MPEDAESVLLLELLVSGYIANERGSEHIESLDLIKAIYIVDFEHVQKFWDDWEDFEQFVSREKLLPGGARYTPYIDRTMYLVRMGVDQAQAPSGTFRGVGRFTEGVLRIISEARALASKRTGNLSTPSSRDLLFSACAQDPALSTALQESGLKLQALAEAVKGANNARRR